MNLSIRKCSISEVLARTDLLEEYADECAIDGLPRPTAKHDMYLHMEGNGSLHTIGAFLDDALIGFITILKPLMPHYSVLVAVMESFFVPKEHRKSGAGIKLIREGEKCAKELGSPGLLISAPFGGSLAEVLPNVGYTETNRVFFKKLFDA